MLIEMLSQGVDVIFRGLGGSIHIREMEQTTFIKKETDALNLKQENENNIRQSTLFCATEKFQST